VVGAAEDSRPLAEEEGAFPRLGAEEVAPSLPSAEAAAFPRLEVAEMADSCVDFVPKQPLQEERVVAPSLPSAEAVASHSCCYCLRPSSEPPQLEEPASNNEALFPLEANLLSPLC